MKAKKTSNRDDGTVAQNTTQPRRAPLLRRLGAAFYDFLLILALFLGTTALYIAVRASRVGIDVAASQAESGVLTQGPLLTILLAIVFVGFFCYFWTRTGQTLGMQAWKVQIVTPEGRTPSLKQSLLRLFGAMISATALGAGYLWILVDKQHLTWHERWSGTITIFQDHKS